MYTSISLKLVFTTDLSFPSIPKQKKEVLSAQNYQNITKILISTGVILFNFLPDEHIVIYHSFQMFRFVQDPLLALPHSLFYCYCPLDSVGVAESTWLAVSITTVPAKSSF